jgi:hypothetical protein
MIFNVDHIPLSAREAVLLDHRLSVPDCIVDALAETYSRRLVENSVARLVLFTTTRIIPTAQLAEIDAVVLADCIEGSTWIAAASAAAEEEEDPEITSRAVSTINRLAEKFRRSGIPVGDVPVA